MVAETCSPIQLLRKPKVWDMSIFDWVTSLLAAVLIGRWFKVRGTKAWIEFILYWTFLGVAIHWVAGVDTMLGYYLGINRKPVRVECV